MAGRPREFDREAALVRARDAFWARGYAGTSMADLAEALGLVSARIYAAFGSKEDLFRETIRHYDNTEGGFARAALAEPGIFRAIERLLMDAINIYTQENRPKGCMIVGSAPNGPREIDGVIEWLSKLRRKQCALIVDRIARAVRDGELHAGTNPADLGEYYSTFLHGLSTQAKDGVSREALIKTTSLAIITLKTHAAGSSRGMQPV